MKITYLHDYLTVPSLVMIYFRKSCAYSLMMKKMVLDIYTSWIFDDVVGFHNCQHLNSLGVTVK